MCNSWKVCRVINFVCNVCLQRVYTR